MCMQGGNTSALQIVTLTLQFYCLTRAISWAVWVSLFLVIQPSLPRGGLGDNSKACSGKKIDCVFRGSSVASSVYFSEKRLREDVCFSILPHNFSSVNCCVRMAATASALFIPCLACLAGQDKMVSYLK